MKQTTLALILAFALLAGPEAGGAWAVPEVLRDKVSVLDAEQRQFLESGSALKYLPERQLRHELETRDEAELRGLIDDLMALDAQMAYDADRDMGAMPLNLESKRFNGSTLPTPPALRDFERAPGPFSVHRYLFPMSGVPTFAGARVAVWPEDLIAGSVDVAIIGVPNNMSSGRRGASDGPSAMRALDTIATRDVQTLLDPLEVLTVVDYGNFSIDNLSTERTIDHVTAMVRETAATGAVPMLVGGDTSLLYPAVKGLAQVHGSGSFGLAHFSAHPDVERFGAHTISDDQAVFRLLDEGIVAGDETIQVGLRGQAVTRESLQWLRDRRVRYHTMAEIADQGFDQVLKRVLAEVSRGPDRLFLSIDVSVIEPAEMVSAGRIASDGLRLSEVRRAIRHICAARDVVGFEITDMAPTLDFSRLSVVNANALLNACLVGMAARAEGLDPDYIHPLARDHGQR